MRQIKWIEKIMDRVINLTPRWEYMSEGDVSLERMNELGAEGWELAYYNTFFAIFKRARYTEE